MKIKTIEASLSRERRYDYDLKEWKGYRVVAELEDGENPVDAKKKLDLELESWQLPINGNSQFANHESTTQLAEIQKYQTTEEKLIQQINETTDKVVLTSFKLLADKYTAVKAAYDKRLKELQP